MDFSKLRSYVMEDEFKITIIKNKINIVNYTDIGHLDKNKIVVRYIGGRAIISGSNLVVRRLLKDEILIIGLIKNIEMDYKDE